MSNILHDAVLWLGAGVISFYTLSYARWLWNQKMKRGAIGVAVLAFLSFMYPGFVLFFVHK
jgi:hypothetical protein